MSLSKGASGDLHCPDSLPSYTGLLYRRPEVFCEGGHRSSIRGTGSICFTSDVVQSSLAARIVPLERIELSHVCCHGVNASQGRLTLQLYRLENQIGSEHRSRFVRGVAPRSRSMTALRIVVSLIGNQLPGAASVPSTGFEPVTYHLGGDCSIR